MKGGKLSSIRLKICSRSNSVSSIIVFSVMLSFSNSESFDIKRAGTGSSEYPDLKAEFSNMPHERGTLSMARSADPNSANSQFFICFKSAPHLDKQYTVFGKVIKGMEFVDLIKKGQGTNGQVSSPDKIISLSSK